MKKESPWQFRPKAKIYIRFPIGLETAGKSGCLDNKSYYRYGEVKKK
jgi:hypothetical protein